MDFAITSDTTCTLVKCDVDSDDIKIPSSVEIDGKNYTVTAIGERAFEDCICLTSVEIPSSVTLIATAAFEGCSDLTSVDIPASVVSIGSRAFRDCTDLASVEIPSSVTTIGYGVFEGCCNLSSFSGKYASDDNRCLIVEGKLVAFAPSGLTTYQIPETATEIGDCAFGDCKDLTSIEIPSSVTSIGDCAFYDCRALTSVEIPASVISIGVYAFFCFGSLQSVTIYSPTPIATMNPEYIFEVPALFDSSVSACTLFVPKGSKALYQTAPSWREFGDIQELE